MKAVRTCSRKGESLLDKCPRTRGTLLGGRSCDVPREIEHSLTIVPRKVEHRDLDIACKRRHGLPYLDFVELVEMTPSQCSYIRFRVLDRFVSSSIQAFLSCCDNSIAKINDLVVQILDVLSCILLYGMLFCRDLWYLEQNL